MAVHYNSKLNSKMIFYSHLTLKYYFLLSFFYFFFSSTSFTHSLSQIKLSPLPSIHHPLTAAIKAHHRIIADSSSFSLSFFFFLPPLLTDQTPLPHVELSRPHCRLNPQALSPSWPTPTHLALSDPSWPLFSIWVTNFFKACLLVYRWVVSVFFIM